MQSASASSQAQPWGWSGPGSPRLSQLKSIVQVVMNLCGLQRHFKISNIPSREAGTLNRLPRGGWPTPLSPTHQCPASGSYMQMIIEES